MGSRRLDRKPSWKPGRAIPSGILVGFRRRVGVVSAHWGLPRKKGEVQSKPCILVVMTGKKRLSELPKRQVFPRFVKLRQRRVRVDIQGAGSHGRLLSGTPASVRPGNNVRITSANGSTGTLGALVDTDNGQAFVVLSAHVATTLGSVLTASLGSRQQVLAPVADRDTAVDVALTQPIAAPDWLGVAAATVRDPSDLDINQRVLIRVTWHFERTGTLSGVRASGDFANRQGQVFHFNNLGTISGFVAESGDSGAPVLSFATGELLGFVLGVFNQQTYFVHARRSINAVLN